MFRLTHRIGSAIRTRMMGTKNLACSGQLRALGGEHGDCSVWILKKDISGVWSKSSGDTTTEEHCFEMGDGTKDVLHESMKCNYTLFYWP
jgi:hypothetical protein